MTSILALCAGLTLSSAVTAAVTDSAGAATTRYVTPHSVTSAAAAFGGARHYHVGVAVYDRATNLTYGAGDFRGIFASESVVKVMIATRLLVQGAMHGRTAAMAYKMITQSDDQMATALYGRVGGDSLINWIKARYRVPDLGYPPSRTGWWGNTHITPIGLVKLYAKLANARRVHSWLINAMSHAHEYGSDGQYQFFGLPSSTTGAAIKQGWGCDLGGGCNEADFNSTGYVNKLRYAVAILVRGPLSSYGIPIMSAITGVARTLLPHGSFPLQPPTVSSLSDSRGALSDAGRVITVHGTNFERVQAVYFGATRVRPDKVNSARSLQVTVPVAVHAGSVATRVETSFGISARHASATFHYIAAPSVAGLSQTSGPTAGGPRLTVSGANFVDVTAVSFGSVKARYSVVSSRVLRVVPPSHPAGAAPVVVRTRYGTSSETSYSYVAPPSLAGLAPPAAPAGTTVTITGTALTGATAVKFGASGATSFTVVSDNEIRAVAPANPAGGVNVVVTTPYGTSNALQFSYPAGSTRSGSDTRRAAARHTAGATRKP